MAKKKVSDDDGWYVHACVQRGERYGSTIFYTLAFILF